MIPSTVDTFHALKSLYGVPCLMNEHKQAVFVLESPHVDELNQGAPVSGLSGKSMYRTLYGEGEKRAIGPFLKEDPLSPLGITNISPIPMQEAAYTHPSVEARYGSFDRERFGALVQALEKIRVNFRARYKDPYLQEVQDILLVDFTERMSPFSGQPLLIIPCGRAAASGWSLSGVSSDAWTLFSGIPHPSFGNWHKAKSAGRINEMKGLIRSL